MKVFRMGNGFYLMNLSVAVYSLYGSEDGQPWGAELLGHRNRVLTATL